MNRRVALLRGINVGTAKRIAMADLRSLFEDLGHQDVRTLLNSGNVVFTAAKKAQPVEASRIERAIATRLGVTTRVTLLSGSELVEAVNENPFPATAHDPSRLLLMAVQEPGAMARLQSLLEERWKPEAVALGKRVAYLWCADGIADSKLWNAAARALGDAGTARNLTTMTRLMALVEGA